MEISFAKIVALLFTINRSYVQESSPILFCGKLLFFFISFSNIPSEKYSNFPLNISPPFLKFSCKVKLAMQATEGLANTLVYELRLNPLSTNVAPI